MTVIAAALTTLLVVRVWTERVDHGSSPMPPQEASTTIAKGCGDVGDIVDSATPDPVERQMGPGHIPPLLSSGTLVRPQDIPPSIDLRLPRLTGGELPQVMILRDVDLDGDGEADWNVQALYGPRPPEADENLAEYLDAGGWYLEEKEAIGQDADEVLSRLAEHGRRPPPPVVAVGPYKAVVIHADPILRNDLRPWHVYWSDGEHDYGLQANSSPQFAVSVARSFYCPGEVVPGTN